MFPYIIRRLAYALPILFAVNVLLFIIFFGVNSPDRMAENILGEKYATPDRIKEWKQEHGYDLPRIFNAKAGLKGCLTQTIFWSKSVRLFVFDFGVSDSDEHNIAAEMRKRIPPSLYITVPTFVIGLLLGISFSLIVAFYRGTYFDTWVLFVCVLMMSVSYMIYVIGGQFLFGRILRLAPVSGFNHSLPYAIRFVLLPIFIALFASIGKEVRYYRTVFLEEINKDYVRTARAKGLGEGKVLFKHVLRNAMLPILTSAVVQLPFLIMGGLLTERFFGIPGLGSYLIDAIGKNDFAVIRSMVFLGAVLYIIGLILVDISYAIADPRIRLGGKQ